MWGFPAIGQCDSGTSHLWSSSVAGDEPPVTFFFWTLDLSCQRKHVSYTRLKAQEDYRILLRTYVIIDYIERLSLHLIFVYIQMILVYES